MPAVLLAYLSPARVEVPGAWTSISIAPWVTLHHLSRVAGYLLVFLLVREILCRFRRQPWLVVLPLIVIGAAEACVGILQHAAGGLEGRVRGTYANRNHFAGLLEMVLPFALLYAVSLIPRARSSMRLALRAGLLMSVAAVIFLGIVYSLSRMGFTAVFCSLFVMGLLAASSRLRPWKGLLVVGLLAIAMLLGFVFLAPDALIDRFAELRSTQEIAAEGRLSLWRATLDLIRASPFFGWGLGAYESALLQRRSSLPDVPDVYAHNDYLQLLAELGVSGVLPLGILLIAVVSIAYRAALQDRDSDSWLLALACVGALAAILIHSSTDFNLYIPANAMLLAWIAGVCVGLRTS